MKKIILTVLVLNLFGGISFLSAEEDSLAEFSSSWTLHDLAASESVPVKPLARDLGLDLSAVSGRSFSELGVSREDAASAIAIYREVEPQMVGSIVMAGMLIVFVSLVVVAFFISLFKHFHIFDKSGSVKTEIGKISSTGDMSDKAVAAVITAVFLYEEEVDTENRLLLTWKRVSARAWKAGVDMPNALHFAARRGR